WRGGPCHRTGNRSGCAMDGLDRPADPCAGAQVRKFRRARFFHQGVQAPALIRQGGHPEKRQARMSEAKLREQVCVLGKSMFDRGLTVGSSGNISVRTDDGWLM